jgi:anti-anti-sigma regulatory factor
MAMSHSVLQLGASLDLTMAAALKADLGLMPAGARLVDAGAVRRVTTPCLQVLLAAGARFTRVSDAFRDTATTLGLDAALDLGNAAHV